MRNIIGLFVVMLFSALGASMAVAVPMNATEIQFFQATSTLQTQTADVGFAARAPPVAVPNVAATGGVTVMHGGAFVTHGVETQWASLNFGADFYATNSGPRISIRDHYEHHNAMRTDVIGQLEGQGYTVSRREVSFGSSCGSGRCRPDIIYEAPDGTVGIIEIKTGNADLTIRQSEIYPQIRNGDAIPRGQVAEAFGLDVGIPLKDQGYPNGIPIEIRTFPGAGQ